MKCLVVDDSGFTRRILVNSLNEIGFPQILEAGDGADALALCTPDVGLVITDWTMPGMSGVELVRSEQVLGEVEEAEPVAAPPLGEERAVTSSTRIAKSSGFVRRVEALRPLAGRDHAAQSNRVRRELWHRVDSLLQSRAKGRCGATRPGSAPWRAFGTKRLRILHARDTRRIH